MVSPLQRVHKLEDTIAGSGRTTAVITLGLLLCKMYFDACTRTHKQSFGLVLVTGLDESLVEPVKSTYRV